MNNNIMLINVKECDWLVFQPLCLMSTGILANILMVKIARHVTQYLILN